MVRTMDNYSKVCACTRIEEFAKEIRRDNDAIRILESEDYVELKINGKRFKVDSFEPLIDAIRRHRDECQGMLDANCELIRVRKEWEKWGPGSEVVQPELQPEELRFVGITARTTAGGFTFGAGH